MRLLIINQFFWPDTAPTGRFLLDVVRALESSEIQITAICGASGYGTTSGCETKDDTPRPAVRILRPSATRFSKDAVGRMLSYGSFLAGAFVAGFRVGRPDTVITLTTPPLTSVFGRMLKLSRGCKHFIWEMDVYPDIAVELGTLKRRSTLTYLIGALADWSRRNADGIIVLGDEMKARLIARDIPEHKIHVAQNWADGTEITPGPFSDGPLVVHYSGNLGLPHDIETISGVIKHLANDPRFQFVFAGGGIRRESMEAFCREHGIANVLFRHYASRSELGASLADGHLGLVTQMPQTCGSIVPSKTYGIMAAGRPILYIGPREATPARIVERFRCGWQVNPGDTAALISLLERLNSERHLIVEAGCRARQAFEKYYDRPIAAARIVQILGLELAAVGAPVSNPRETSYLPLAPASERHATAAAGS
ncbi:MAG: glycosyltransferase family 4 protein [Bryobacteraceae bacterium]|jgi:glycosyltransferase involved in cell wall biosynthesis